MKNRKKEMKRLGVLLKNLRNSLGINQVDMAKEIGTNQSVLSKLENGLTMPEAPLILNAMRKEIGPWYSDTTTVFRVFCKWTHP